MFHIDFFYTGPHPQFSATWTHCTATRWKVRQEMGLSRGVIPFRLIAFCLKIWTCVPFCLKFLGICDIFTAVVEVAIVAPHITVAIRVSLAVVSSTASSMAGCCTACGLGSGCLYISVFGHCWLLPLQPPHYPNLGSLSNKNGVTYTWTWFILAAH